jgi:hypothetical protein
MLLVLLKPLTRGFHALFKRGKGCSLVDSGKAATGQIVSRKVLTTTEEYHKL